MALMPKIGRKERHFSTFGRSSQQVLTSQGSISRNVRCLRRDFRLGEGSANHRQRMGSGR